MTVPAPACTSAVSDFEPAIPFLLASPRGGLVGNGVHCILDPVPSEHLPAVVAQYFAGLGDDEGNAVVVGALPFDRARPAHLYAPAHVTQSGGDGNAVLPSSTSASSDQVWRVSAEPTRAGYAQSVNDALALMGDAHSTQARPLRKVVLARTLLLQGHSVPDVGSLISALRQDPSITTFCVPLPGSTVDAPRALVGATPELLVGKHGSVVTSHPLAGSARRHADPVQDREAADQLLHSDKDLREHAAVVEWVSDRLTPFCKTLHVPTKPSITSTRTMWHLGTPIQGELCDPEISSVALASALHPTPAVCGLPYDPAMAAIADLEAFDRGFFAGAVGWCNSSGDGEWFVSIRCAELCGPNVRLYAGAGIVLGSDPEAEVAETAGKLTTLLRALGIDEDGNPLQKVAQ